MIELNLKPKILTIFGRRGSGKSYLNRVIIKTKLNDRPVILIDTLGEYADLNYPTVSDVYSFIDYLETEETNIRVLVDRKIDIELFLEVINDVGNCYVVIEEADRFCSSAYIPDSFDKLIRYGRHQNIGIVAISRRPAEVNRELTSQANYLITFTQHEPNDLKYLGAFIPKDKINSLPTLPQYAYIGYNSDTGDIFNSI